MPEQLRFVRHLHQPSQVHHAHLVRHVANHRQVVADEQIGQALAALQVFHDVEDLRLNRDVQSRRGLVANQELGLRRQRARNRDALALATAELVRELLAIGGGQTHLQQQLTHLGAQCLCARHQPVLAQGFAHDVQHLPAGVEAGVRILKDHLHAPAQGAHASRVLGGIGGLSIKTHIAPGRLVKTHQQTRHGALAAA